MPLLISKIQYNTFETGEFVEKCERTFEEVVELIEQFPWELQRDHIMIELTNPSITLHGKNGDYLKLALYYKGKFVLRYVDKEDKLYSKGFYDLKESYGYIKKLYDLAVFDCSDFKKENTWLEKNLIHFVSQDFSYEVSADSAMRYLISTSWINFLTALFLFGLFEFKKTTIKNLTTYLFVSIFSFIIGGGLNLILFFQYYFYSKDKILIMSKGNDEFYFGNKEQPIKYNKSQILRYKMSNPKRNRDMLASFSIISLEIENGTKLVIPNIMVDENLLSNKLSSVPVVYTNKYPFLKIRFK